MGNYKENIEKLEKQKFYFLKEKREPPNKDVCIWDSRPSFIPFILNRKFLDTIVILCVLWYFDFTFFIFTNLLLFIYFISWVITIYEYLTTQYFITLTHLVLHIGSKYYYYPIDKLEKEDFEVHFNIFDLIFKCKTITYAYYKLKDVPKGVWISVRRRATGNSNIWYKKATFCHIKDYDMLYEHGTKNQKGI